MNRQLLFLLILFLPSIVIAKSRKSFELYGAAPGNRTSDYADDSRSVADQINSQSASPNSGSIKMNQSGEAGVKFSMLWPISNSTAEMGFSIAGGVGPQIETTLRELPDFSFQETVQSNYMTLMLEGEKNKWVKAFNFSLRGGIGFLSGKITHTANTYSNSFILPSAAFAADEEKKWSGITAGIIPSIGIGNGRHELRLGFGWRYIPKTPAMDHLPRLDTSPWSGSLSYLW